MAEKILKSIIFPGLEDTYIVPEQIQVDWNQNDETAQDYIKNRPFYTGDLVKTELVPEQTVEGFAVMQDPIYAIENPFEIELVEGQEYKVVWDGVEYNVTCFKPNFNVDNMLYCGNENYVNMESGGDIPFAIISANDIIYLVTESTDASHTISVSCVKEQEVVKLDPKYLPEGGVGYTETTTETEIFDIIQIANDFGAEWEEFTADNSPTGRLSFGLQFFGAELPIGFIPENEYTISANGTSYTGSAVDISAEFGMPCVGLGDIDGMMSGDFSNFRYVVEIMQSEGQYVFQLVLDAETFGLTEAPTEVTISGSIITEVIHEINPKFLPEGGVGYTTYDKEGTLLYDTVEVTELDSYTKIPASLTFIEGETYSVTFNGELYECVAWTSPNNESVICIGNGNIYGGEGKGNNEPFSFDSHNNGVCYLNTAYCGTYRITIEGKSGVYHKIDKKFLPKQIQSNWNENDIRSDGYIANRPFYESLVPTDELLAGSTGWAEAGSAVEISDYSTFIEGKTYLVIFNYVPYECVAWTDSSSDRVYLGNGTINGLENGNNEPFLCSSYGDRMCYLYVPETCSFDISIYPLVSNVVKLDKKFLPNDIIPNSELNAESENPVQNKVVAEAISNLNENINNLNDDINNLSALVGETPVSEQISNAIAEIPEQVQPDWNQIDKSASDYIKNRTHYIESMSTISWNGDITDRECVGTLYIKYYKVAGQEVADKITKDVLAASTGTMYGKNNGEDFSETVVFDEAFSAEDIISAEGVLVAKKDNLVVEGIQIPSAGVYFAHRKEDEQNFYYLSKLSYPGIVKTLPDFYIPDTIARISDIPNDFSGSWNDLTDKPFDDAIVYEWDESVEYQEYVSIENPFGTEIIKLAKISNDAPDSEFFIGKTCNVWSRTNGESEYITGTIERNHIHTEEGLDGVYLLLDPILVVNTDSYAPEGVPVSRGMWCAHEYIDPSNAITKIQIVVQEGIQLDEKYIPDTIARVSEIPEQVQPDWAQTDETATNYIKNKPILATSEEIKALFN